MSTSSPRICIAGGGTGGHVMPALSLADAVRERWQESAVTFIGAERGLEARLLPERGESVLLLTMHAIQGASLLQKLRVLLWELPNAVLRILKAWRGAKPSVLVGVGGYASVAGVLAALVSRIPVVLYEQNAIPGMVNRLLYRFCDVMMLGFESAKAHLPDTRKAVVTGNVVRKVISEINYAPAEKPHLLIVGGSQGAMFLNENVPLACAKLAEQGKVFSVTHLVGAGEGRVEQVQNIYQQAGIEADVSAYANEIQALMSQASMMFARAGAMTVCEASAAGIPTVFVPLPWAADNHQFYNAKAVAGAGGAMICEQKECDLNTLAERIESMLFDKDKLQDMSKNMKAVFVENSGGKQCDVLARFIGESQS